MEWGRLARVLTWGIDDGDWRAQQVVQHHNQREALDALSDRLTLLLLGTLLLILVHELVYLLV